MKNSIIKFSLIGIISLFLTISAFAQTKKTSEKPVEPTVKEAIKEVMLNGNILLSSGKDCQSVKTAPTDKTLLDFLSGVLSFQAEPNSANQIEFTFKEEKGRMNEILWVCDLMFRGKDGEDVWSNGIRFKMRNASRKMLRESLACIGTS